MLCLNVVYYPADIIFTKHGAICQTVPFLNGLRLEYICTPCWNKHHQYHHHHHHNQTISVSIYPVFTTSSWKYKECFARSSYQRYQGYQVITSNRHLIVFLNRLNINSGGLRIKIQLSSQSWESFLHINDSCEFYSTTFMCMIHVSKTIKQT